MNFPSNEPVAYIHFCVACQPGESGMASGSMVPRNTDKLPAELLKNVQTQAGARYRFACSRTKQPDAYNVMTDMPCHVTCPKCRLGNSWLNAPDNGPFPKNPELGFQVSEEEDNEQPI